MTKALVIFFQWAHILPALFFCSGSFCSHIPPPMGSEEKKNPTGIHLHPLMKVGFSSCRNVKTGKTSFLTVLKLPEHRN